MDAQERISSLFISSSNGIIRGKEVEHTEAIKRFKLTGSVSIRRGGGGTGSAYGYSGDYPGKRRGAETSSANGKRRAGAALEQTNPLDVWAMDEDETIYETEVQKNNTRNLPKRSRLYQGIIDSKLLPPGEIDYNRLPDIFIIIIMPFDLFGKGRYRYTFYNQCEEVPGLPMGDGAVHIFLNTRGNVKDESVSQELIDLLHYFECSRPEVAEKSESERIHHLQTRVETIRASEETGVRFMNAWEERILDRQEGFAEGKQAGLEEGLEEGKAIQTREIARKLKGESFPKEKIAELTGLSLEEIEKI